MTAGACGTNLPPQMDIFLEAITYCITATVSNKIGYSHLLCYSCDIKPSGQPIITFNKDFIKISQIKFFDLS